MSHLLLPWDTFVLKEIINVQLSLTGVCFLFCLAKAATLLQPPVPTCWLQDGPGSAPLSLCHRCQERHQVQGQKHRHQGARRHRHTETAMSVLHSAAQPSPGHRDSHTPRSGPRGSPWPSALHFPKVTVLLLPHLPSPHSTHLLQLDSRHSLLSY